MGGEVLKCASGGCGRDAYVISGKFGIPVCERCHEETDLMLPHVTWRERWRRWRADSRAAWRRGREVIERDLREIEERKGPPAY